MSYEKLLPTAAVPALPLAARSLQLLVVAITAAAAALAFLICTDDIQNSIVMKPLRDLASSAAALLLCGTITTTTSAAAAAAATTTATNTTNTTLLPFLLHPLPLGTTHASPSSWLHATLRLSATGLAGHLASFYPYVADSSWLGGSSEYSGLNEGFAYWLNGLVPLAYGLRDEGLKGQVRRAVGAVLERQDASGGDGWLGPEEVGGRNLWARYPVLLGLVGVVEAEEGDADGGDAELARRVVEGMWRFVGLMAEMLRDGGRGYVWREGDALSEEDFAWGRVRVQDLLVSLQWLWERGETTEAQRGELAECMRILIEGAIDWADWWREGAFIKGDLNFLDTEPSDGPRYPYEHGVNAGQGLKALAVFRRFTHNQTLVDITRRGVDWTFRYHAAAHGGILADERLAGLAPYYGSETCTLVETMYSLSYLYQTLGNNSYADLAETIAFNALPAQMSPNWWGRQYVGQPNQGFATELDENPFYNVRESGLLYSVEANYPCCTVNHPQGLPKFLANAFARVGDSNGIAHMLLSPANVSTTLPNGGHITIACDTHYPFANTLHYTLTASHPTTFHVRVPTWADPTNSSLAIINDSSSSSASSPLRPDPTTGLHPIPLPAGTTRLTYTLAAPLTVAPRANDTFTVRAGALVFALAVPSTNASASPPQSFADPAVPLRASNGSGGIPPPAVDWRLTNASAWNVAVDERSLALRTSLDDGDGDGAVVVLPDPVFAPGAAPVWVEGRGCVVEGWGLYKGVPGLPPGRTREERTCVEGSVRAVRLEPVGAAKLRLMDLVAVDLPEEEEEEEEEEE